MGQQARRRSGRGTVLTGARLNLEPLRAALDRGATILVPNDRSREAILASLLASANSGTPADPASRPGADAQAVMATPDVLPVDIWIKRQWDLAASRGIAPCAELGILSANEEFLVWLQLIESSLPTLPLLHPEDTARNVAQAYQTLRQFRLDEAGELRQFAASADVSAFLDWARGFGHYCETHHCLALVDATTRIVELYAEGVLPAPEDLLLVNFLQAPPLYQTLFARLPGAQTLLTVPEEAAEVERSRRSYADPDSELQACASWVAETRRRAPAAHIGVICNERSARQAEFARSLQAAIDPGQQPDFDAPAPRFNSARDPRSLAETPLVFDALLVLGLMNPVQDSERLCRLLHSPYILSEGLPDAPEWEPRLQMERQMRRRFSRECRLQDFSWHLEQEQRDCHCPQLAAALVAFRTRLRAAPRRDDSRGWTACFAELLACLEWPGPVTAASESDGLRQWQALLEQFAAMSALLGPLSAEQALARLDLLCRQTAQRAPGSGMQPVSFYTAAEAQGLHFDYLWLLGCHDEAWPPPARRSPFLPRGLLQQAKVPGSSSQLQFDQAAREFATLMHSVNHEVVASFYQVDGDRQLRPSHFILEFPETEAADTVPHEDQAGELRQRDDQQHLALPEEARVGGGHGVISDQAACPFRAFARHRLRVRPLEAFPGNLTALSRGNAAHVALDTLFGELQSLQDLLDCPADSRRRHCNAAADEAVSYLQSRHRHLMTPRFRQIEQRRIRILLESFLELEAQRSPFTVFAREKKIGLELEGLSLSLTVDRLDRLPDESLAIIDYKTGRNLASQRSWLEGRSEDMQLPVYMVAAQALEWGQVSVISLAQVNAENVGYRALSQHDNFHPSVKPVAQAQKRDWQELAAQFDSQVGELAREFVDGRLDVHPLNGLASCRYCGLQALCRIQERQVDPAADGEES